MFVNFQNFSHTQLAKVILVWSTTIMQYRRTNCYGWSKCFGKETRDRLPSWNHHNEWGTTSKLCCQYDPTDCTLRYSTSVYRNYYSRCNGENYCLIQISWVPTPCNHTVYLPRTNYMRMEYYLIAGNIDLNIVKANNLINYNVIMKSPNLSWTI